MEFDSNSRLMLIAPHPDDETLGCGVVLQRAVRAGVAIRVVYATDGENNPWPQRLIERKWRLEATDRKRWGELRRGEALAALTVLGINPFEVRFLGLPDQGLTDVLIGDCRRIMRRFVEMVQDWTPTHLLIPSVCDTHPDHNALATMLRLALSELSPDERNMFVWSYAVHGDSRTFLDRAEPLRQSTSEASTKILAIQCHQTQLRFSKERFLGYAHRPERFVPLVSDQQAIIDGAICSISRQQHFVRLDLQLSLQPFAALTPRILVFGYDAVEGPRCVAIQVPARPGKIDIRGASNGMNIGTAEYYGDAFAGTLSIPVGIFSRNHALFVKVERRGLRFFDEAGWSAIPRSLKPQSAFSSDIGYSPQLVRQVRSDEEMIAESPHATADPEGGWLRCRWAISCAVILIWLGMMLAANITRPWITVLDFNGAVWSQSAHNILRAGLAKTSGASSGFYFGQLPIPTWGYYLHHPPLLHLFITALFAVFGEHEWVARLVPIGCSLLSAMLLWLLVRSCIGNRAATLSMAVFACLPMELRYGRMVNFEPCVLMLILATLLCLRRWKLSGKTFWQCGAVCLILLGLWVDWAMHIFVLAACVCWLMRASETKRLAWTLLIVAVLSVIVYLIRIQLLRPDAWQNLSNAFFVRLGSGGGIHFTELQWIEKVSACLLGHFLVLGWILSSAGLLIALLMKRRDEGCRWLLKACICVFVMDAVFVTAFQNDSYIHQYIAFYLLLPVAIMSGIALDYLITISQSAFTRYKRLLLGEVAACLLVLTMGTRGAAQTHALQRQFCILDYKTPEPANLIPQLGSEIQKDFPPGTRVLCNFLPEYGPQFAYYAQRDILNNLSEYRFWQRYLNDSSKSVGGVVWMAPKTARDLISKLPPGSKRFFNVGNLSFCLWQADQLAVKQSLAKDSTGNL